MTTPAADGGRDDEEHGHESRDAREDRPPGDAGIDVGVQRTGDDARVVDVAKGVKRLLPPRWR